jgi:putative membrane-bound dehydrogenase-like protein
MLQSGLRFPTDIKVWRKGVIVCDAPDIIYLEDSDGDGDADIRKTLLTGFATHNAQARVNSLRWGLDNWLYGSCGLFGGRIRSWSGTELELGASDFRFRPDTGEIEPVTGKTQQGRVRDDWGNWFGCENGSLCDHYPLSNRYLARNPHVVPPPTEVPVPAGDDPSRLFPSGQLVLFQLSGAPGRPTAACGLEIYRDNLLGSELLGNALVAEPVNQLLHRRVLERRGAIFTGHRAANETNREFLTSTDPWFRPVQIRTGLDGCLWIVDMCRYVIEHPRFIPQETLQALDPMAGKRAGRIFRIRPRNAPPRTVPRFDQLDTAGLVAALASVNGPQRDLAQQILVERHDQSAVPALEQVATGASLAQSRLQALCTLEGLACLRPEMLLRALRDSHPAVRSHAIRLSEPFLRDSGTIHETILALVGDDDPQVQLQLAYTLGQSRDAKAGAALGDLAWKHHGDRYLSTAILSSINPENARGVLQSILSRGTLQDLPPAIGDAVTLIATKLGNDTCRNLALTSLSQAHDGEPSPTQLEVLAAILEGVPAPARQHEPAEAAKRSPMAETLVKLARRVAENPENDDRKLLAAVRILACTTTDDTELSHLLVGMLAPQRSPEVQQAAVKLAAGLSPAVAGELLLTNWVHYSPAVRAQAIDVFFSRDELLPILLQAVESDVVKPATFDARERERLLKHEAVEIREAAMSAFQGAIDPDRKKVIESYAAAARRPGNGSHGHGIFQKMCASCHFLEGHGFAVGPDLAALSNRTAASLLESILDPNRAIDERYQSYLAVNKEGRSFAGILTRETANSVTLTEQQGKEHTLLRNSLEELVNTGQSLMPEGYEKDILPGDMADLLAYLASCGLPPKAVLGNRAEPIQVTASGSVWLLAANCEIRGQEITFEKPFENIGMWHGESDHVAWGLETTNERAYDVYLEWACTEESAGSQLVLEGFVEPIQFTVPSTGSWSSYRTARIGAAILPAGKNRIIARAGGKLVGPALLDLRGIYLVHVGANEKAAAPDASEQIPVTADAATAITQLLEGLAVGTPQEYEQIPAIWKHAIAAGKRNDTSELQHLLLLSIPEINKDLAHWQAVVIGGGIVNGLTMNGTWPGHRIHELLAGNKPLLARWERLVELSAVMADDESVPPGTRYDALRILGTQPFESSGEQLIKYLDSKSVDLQMGAVSGLGDIDDKRSAAALLSKLSEYAPVNRELAIDALLRTDTRTEALLDALESTRFSIKLLTEEQRRKLVELKKE